MFIGEPYTTKRGAKPAVLPTAVPGPHKVSDAFQQHGKVYPHRPR